MHVLETKNLTHIYGAGTPFESRALDDVSISIEKGEFLGVIGHTGSGKSTLIQHLNGLLRPESGEVLFRGENIWEKGYDRRALRFNVGLVFQYPEYQLFEETVRGDIAFGPRNMGLSEDEIEARVRYAARVMGVDEALMDKSPFELSGGQKRRVALAGVFAMRPEVLILDEPTAGLDPVGREEMLEMIQGYRAESGSTILLVTHSMEEIARYVDRIIVMNKARIFMEGDPNQIFSKAHELEAIGLSVPMITSVFLRLRDRKLVDDAYVYTVSQGRDRLLRLFERRRRGC